jgi:hypothetical protein
MKFRHGDFAPNYDRDGDRDESYVKFRKILSESWSFAHATPLRCDLKLLNFINITEV